MKKQSKVSIVIPTYNGSKLLQKCLASLIKQNIKPYEILIVDNGSTDRTSIDFRNRKDTKYIRLNRNHGFAKACNIGIKKAKGDLVAILNNDAFPEREWLQNILEAVNRHPEVSVFASRILKFNAPNVIDSVGDYINHELRVLHRGEGELDLGQFNKDEYIYLVPATAAVYRKKYFAQIGLFDEDFNSYFEDVDLSLRGILQNCKYLYVHNAIVKHIGKATSDKIYLTRGFLEVRNSILVWLKNLPIRVLINPIVAWKLTNFYLKLTFQSLKPSNLLLIIKVLLYFVTHARELSTKRKLIQETVVVSNDYLMKVINCNKYPSTSS